VPEHHPVPGFITGEQWEYAGTCDGLISPLTLNPTTVETGSCLDSFHLFETANPYAKVTTPVYSAHCGAGASHCEENSTSRSITDTQAGASA
jgi:hypothetical protein